MDKTKIILRSRSQQPELTEEEMLKHALLHIFEASNYFELAGFDKTTETLRAFLKTSVEMIETHEDELSLVADKLSNTEYDTILNDILSMGE